MATATLPTTTFDFGLRPRDLVDPGDRSADEQPGDRGGLTLDELLVSAWEGLRTDHSAACPVCGGTLEARFGSGHRPVAGHCSTCGTHLH